MSLLLHALKQIDARPESTALPANPPPISDPPAPISVKPPVNLSTPMASPAMSGAPVASAELRARSISTPSVAAANANSGRAAPKPERTSSGDTSPRATAARTVTDVVTDAQRHLADSMLAMLTGSPRLVALLAAGAPTDVCSVAGDLALGLAARGTGDVLLVGSAGEARHTAALDPERSLADIVSGRMSWSDSIIASGLERLSLLERGTPADEQSLTARRFAEAWRALPRQFHHVVIDAGSVGADSLPPLLSTCDATLLVVRLGATSQAQVDEAIERLRSAGIMPSGCLALACNSSSAAA